MIVKTLTGLSLKKFRPSGSHKESAMIAFFPKSDESDYVSKKIEAIDNATRPGELHVTLFYVPKAKDSELSKFVSVIRDIAKQHGPMKAKVGGFGSFHPKGDTYPLYASVDSKHLTKIREEIVVGLESVGIKYESEHGFTPHMTLAYLDKGVEAPALNFKADLSFRAISIVWKGTQIDIDLEGA